MHHVLHHIAGAGGIAGLVALVLVLPKDHHYNPPDNPILYHPVQARPIVSVGR